MSAGSVPMSTGSAAYTPTVQQSLRVTVTQEGRYAMPFKPYVYGVSRLAVVSRNRSQ